MNKDITVTYVSGEDQIFTVTDEVATEVLSRIENKVIRFESENEETVVLYTQNIGSIVIEDEAEEEEEDEYDGYDDEDDDEL